MKPPRKIATVLKGRVRTVLRYAAARAGRQRVPLSPANWGISSDAGRGLTLDGIALHELLGRWGSPLHVVNAARLRENASQFLSTPQGCDAGCEIFYSYKSNPVPGVLAILHACGLGAEVISPYELWLARKLGVPSRQIVYNGPAKSPESIRKAIEDDIQLLCVNHREELSTVIAAARDVGKRPRVAIRITVRGGWTAQFGIPVEDAAALDAYREAIASQQLQVIGLQVHRGGMIRSEREILDLVEFALTFADTLRHDLSLDLKVIDFGGSLCPPTVASLSARDRLLNQALQRELRPPDTSRALTIERYTSVLVARVDAHYRELSLPRPRIFLEPGRAMTSDAQFLLASVVTTKRAAETTYAVLDAGINLAESVRSEYHQLLPVNRYGEPATRVHTIVGPICSPGDTLYQAIRLPELQPRDSLAVMDSGSYFVPFATSFSFPRPAILLINAGREQLLRRAEQFEDLVAYDQPPLSTPSHDLSVEQRTVEEIG
jgi:diaminopimelate decarboxylase